MQKPRKSPDTTRSRSSSPSLPPRKMTLEATVYTSDQLREVELQPGAHVALAGRSNVGKSSLVNRLGGSKKLARVSQSPGKTRSLNFYRVEPGGYYIVDLPGYGYAKCSKTEREAWARLIDKYLAATPHLAGVVMLIDSRHEPQKLDMELASYLTQSGIPALAVLTKADKTKQNVIGTHQEQWKDILRSPYRPLAFSAKSGKGEARLWQMLDEAAATVADDESVDGLDD